MSRLLIVSNRLPVTLTGGVSPGYVEVSSGGLVTALRAVVRTHESFWIGWSGADHQPILEERLRSSGQVDGCHLVPVFLSAEEKQDFYCGFCNEILWPLFHDLQSRCNFEPAYWRSYMRVNKRFAETIASVAKAEDIVWVHDYHLMLLGDALAQKIDRSRLIYFHHIPFPPVDVFEKLPWRQQVLHSLLGFGCLGFQTDRDRKNFIGCVRKFLPEVRMIKSGAHLWLRQAEGETLVGSFPIGIDFKEFSEMAAQPETGKLAAQIRMNLRDCRIVLGVDRLDYTKGLPERLKAFHNFLEHYPGLRGKISLLQVVVPSREDIPKYQELKIEVERMVGSINGHFGRPSWVPVHYLHRNLSRAELLAYYRAADIALITPLKDGMNLVAKEFCASRVDEKAVLILSEFAGAASQLRDCALLVNPYDTEAVASTLYEAFHMTEPEARRRMRRMRARICARDVHQWCRNFFELAGTSYGMVDTSVIQAKTILASPDAL